MSDRIAINIGNSRVACGFFRDGKLAESWHYPTANIEAAVAQIVERLHAEPHLEVALGSVVPDAARTAKRMFMEFDIQCFEVTLAAQHIIHGAYSTLGADRIAAGAAGVRRYPGDHTLLVFDFGTATTLSAIETSGRFLGGYITLGLGKTLDSLHKVTAQLPDLKQMLGAPVADGLPMDTEQSIMGGSVLAHVGLFESWLERSRKIFASDVVVVATGGYARYLSPYTDKIDHYEPNLVLIGINLLAEEAKVPEGRA